MNAPNFFMVWREYGGAPTVKHARYEDAKREAERLAHQHPGHKFVVLCSVAHCQHTAVVWTEHDQIPF